MGAVAYTIELNEYLGPRETRFFGEGYKRARHDLDVLAHQRDSLEGIASVSYPDDWSKKGDASQRAHLSTVDVLLFGVQVAELILVGRYGLTETGRRQSWVRSASIAGGASPVEDSLSALAVAGLLRSTAGFGSAMVSSVVTVKIASLNVKVEIVHPPTSTNALEPDLAATRGLLAESRDQLYRDGYKRNEVNVETVLVEPGGTQGSGALSIGPSAGAARAPFTGLEGQFGAVPSFIDAFVAALQAGQVLLYELDGIKRAESNTLWMRRTRISAPGPLRQASKAAFRVELSQPRVVVYGGSNWRAATIKAEVDQISVACSVTHRVSDEAA
ncbi:AvrD family protein [Rhodococcus sp. I2R]|uniref:AvrD family protein n=1 Tax=Rhodococcus sp. I2R TaxID=2855445 RepID=UPI001E5C5847|nr:AvrD family protein [Rhodococcus sp. I2R]MCC8929101.1 hypothetical protein [Rhodococcus sp. I2R]